MSDLRFAVLAMCLMVAVQVVDVVLFARRIRVQKRLTTAIEEFNEINRNKDRQGDEWKDA